jgi:hypothetical protein
MMARIRSSATLTLVSVALVAVACSERGVLGPPDVNNCTAGTLRPSAAAPDTVVSVIDDSRCLRYSSLTLREVYGESWTLELQPATAYVIRLLPAETTPGIVPLNGLLSAVARNAQGDPGLVSLGLPHKDVDAGNVEMIITSATRRTIAVRVEGQEVGDLGPYRLTIEQCPVVDLPLDSVLANVRTTQSCLSRSWAGGTRRLTFASAALARRGEHTFEFDRTAGAASVRSVVAGPDLDLMGFDESSVRLRAPTAGTAYTLRPYITIPGRYAFVFETHPDSSATLALRVRDSESATLRPHP